MEAVESQRKEDFIKVVENALWYFGGVPSAILSDNLKSAIEQASHYEPVVNATFQDFALYYHTAILATRAAKPKDKALVEGAVKLAYTRIFAPLRNQQFFSLQQLNRAIHDKLYEHNTTNFTGRDYSRLMLFNQIEKNLLSALPQEKYELKKFKQATVYKSSHIWLGEDKHYYSVPYRYLKEKVKIVYSSSAVEIFHKHIRIAIHRAAAAKGIKGLINIPPKGNTCLRLITLWLNGIRKSLSGGAWLLDRLQGNILRKSFIISRILSKATKPVLAF